MKQLTVGECRVKKFGCKLGALQRAFRELDFVRQGGDVLRPYMEFFFLGNNNEEFSYMSDYTICISLQSPYICSKMQLGCHCSLLGLWALGHTSPLTQVVMAAWTHLHALSPTYNYHRLDSTHVIGIMSWLPLSNEKCVLGHTILVVGVKHESKNELNFPKSYDHFTHDPGTVTMQLWWPLALIGRPYWLSKDLDYDMVHRNLCKTYLLEVSLMPILENR